MSIATEAFAWALDELGDWQSDDLERRPAYDLWAKTPPPSTIESGNGSAPKVAPESLAGLPGEIAAARRALDAGELSSVELVEKSLAAIERDSERLTAFVEVLADTARAAAQACDAELSCGELRGPLHGIPISVKDVIHVAGATTRCGSLAYENHPGADAWAVARARDAGAVILGKTSTHEYALGVTSPQARNPHDETRIPGGSSGGSGIAVATGMGLASICTDTRASSRVPAALCGVVGFKPAYGTIPTRGVVPLSWTMDHVGVLAANVSDAAVLLDVLQAGEPVATSANAGVSGLRVTLPTAAWEGCDEDVIAAVDTAVEVLRSESAQVTESGQPAAEDFEGANAMGLLVSRSEAATFHRRLANDRSLYWDEVRDQLNAADAVLAVDYIEAQRYRAWLREKMLTVLSETDLLAMPTCPVTAPLVEKADEYLTILSRNAILWSFVGFPAVSVPCGVSPSGLPVGIQLVSSPGNESKLVAAAHAIELALADS